jgi:hypothetical protein
MPLAAQLPAARAKNTKMENRFLLLCSRKSQKPRCAMSQTQAFGCFQQAVFDSADVDIET